MKAGKIILIALVVLIIGFGAYVAVKLNGMKMKYANTFTVNSPAYPTKVLIATQGSDFKNKLIDKIIESISHREIHIKVVDVSLLTNENPSAWKAVLIISSIEANNIHPAARAFLLNPASTAKTLVIATGTDSWNRASQYDAISTASVVTNLKTVVNTAVPRFVTLITATN